MSEPRRSSLREREHNARRPTLACALFKHVSAETIVYNVSEESNLLARRSRSYPVCERERERWSGREERKRWRERKRARGERKRGLRGKKERERLDNRREI